MSNPFYDSLTYQIDGISILEFLDKLESEFPYKIPGRSETYRTYNEAWCDAIDRVRDFIEEKINK